MSTLTELLERVRPRGGGTKVSAGTHWTGRVMKPDEPHTDICQCRRCLPWRQLRDEVMELEGYLDRTEAKLAERDRRIEELERDTGLAYEELVVLRDLEQCVVVAHRLGLEVQFESNPQGCVIQRDDGEWLGTRTFKAAVEAALMEANDGD